MPYIVAFCGTCNEPRYRSTKSLEKGDHFTPDVFRPVNKDIPPPDPIKALCYLCQSTLRFISEEVLGHSEEIFAQNETTTSPSRTHEVTAPEYFESPASPEPPPATPSGTAIVELFRVEKDETIADLQDLGEALLILTNKRIVKIQK